MAKKLKAELELENAKAKRQAAEVGEAAEKSFDRAADSANRMADGLNVSSKTLLRVAGSFGGMLAGTAVRALALKQPEGSTAQKALDYGGGALQGAGQGAMMGSMFGPLGTAIGALAGAANAIANKFLDEAEAEKKKQEALEKTNAANREFVEGMLEAQARTSEFRTMIENLGDTERSLSDRQAEVAAEIQKRIAEEERLKSGLKNNSGKFADEEDQKLLREQVKDYQANHAELERLQQMQKSLAKGTQTTTERTSFGAADALSKVGGSFGGGGDSSRDQLAVARDSLSVLKSIEQKTGKTKSGTF
jgi:hypothetical protein